MSRAFANSTKNKLFRFALPKALTCYLAIAGAFLIAILALKVVEFCITDIDINKRFQLLINALTYNCVVVSWTILFVGMLHWLIGLASRKAANITVSVIFALFLLSEVGLTLYTQHNGFLLGSELLARPLNETLLAIRGSMGIATPILLTIILFAGFIALALWRAKVSQKKKNRNKTGRTALAIAVSVFILLSLIFKTSKLFTFDNYDYFVHNKTYYLFSDSIHYLRTEQDAIAATRMSDEDIIELLASHPEWNKPSDLAYPLERPFVADTFLNGYFKDCNTQPNVVIIIVESLGHEYMGWGSMPFIDSLAATGLYWPNCLSTTIRSYGAMPAITGSVGGPKCFQFGRIPDHNSLFSLLKNEGYNTRAYYAGDFSFDNVYEYLTAQNIDYLSPFYDDFKASPEGEQGYWWGANDDYLFQRTMDDLKSVTGPHLSVITTLTMHDKLNIPDKECQAAYEQKAKQLTAKNKDKVSQELTANLFTDDCIRDFFHRYSQRPDFNNTIFVITGDHASGHQHGDNLSYHHVPLVIWSPLVTKNARFSHVVTHNDIAPALYSLLSYCYGLSAQPTVHWLGDGLGPSPKTLLIVNYSHEISDIIFHNYYYQSESLNSPESLHSFDSSMLLKPCLDTSIINTCQRQLELMRGLYFYTYQSNHLTAHPVFKHGSFLLKLFQSDTNIVCHYPDALPSIVGEKVIDLIPQTLVPHKTGYSSLRINVEADVTVNKALSMLQYPDIRFRFSGSKELIEGDKICKFFTSNEIGKADTYHLSMSKELPMRGQESGQITVELVSPNKDEQYMANVTVSLSNLEISLSYVK